MSVIIAAWNAEATIQEAIESALIQSQPPLEVIVVDDGSDDDTARVVRSVKSPIVRLIRQANRGQSAALNRGVAAARGTYIKFLDADDLLNPQHLSSQLEVLSGHTTLLASCRWSYFVDRPSERAIRDEHTNRDYDSPVEWILDSLRLDEGMTGGWMWLIPWDVLRRAGGWDERLSLNNDFDFSIRLLLSSSGVRYAPDAVYHYRKGMSEALSATRGSEAMRSAFATTEAGCGALLAREDSPRMRQACADRWQWWLYRFYPQHPELAARAEAMVAELGGSRVRLDGGVVLRLLVPVIGWKRVRRLQALAYSHGWEVVLEWKSRRRTARFGRTAASRVW